VLFKPSPKSIVKAFIASRVYRGKPIEEEENKKFYFEESVDAESLDYDSLYSRYKEEFGGLDFLEDQKLWEILEDEIFWASRFNSVDRFQLVFTVLAQIERTGTKAYLAQQSPEAKEMKDRVRRVTGEFRRAKQYIAFAEDAQNKVMIGKASFEHRIIDLVLRHYAKRHPGDSVVILDEEHAHICFKDEILIDSRKKFPERPGRKDAARYWMLFSDLKHLESKRDREYYAGALPTNYWKWVSDGAQVFGTIPKTTLDDFSS
ncbi:MAG: DUF4130 domain-containing protein, partial [Thermoplasmata archaeon]